MQMTKLSQNKIPLHSPIEWCSMEGGSQINWSLCWITYRIMTISNVWPARWVGPLTCHTELWTLSKPWNRLTFKWCEWWRWKFMSPTITILSIDVSNCYENKADSAKHVAVINGKKWKCVIFKCYSSEKLIALNTLHEVVPTWYSFHSWVDWSNADKVSCSRRKHIDAGVRTVNLLYTKSTI